MHLLYSQYTVYLFSIYHKTHHIVGLTFFMLHAVYILDSAITNKPKPNLLAHTFNIRTPLKVTLESSFCVTKAIKK